MTDLGFKGGHTCPAATDWKSAIRSRGIGTLRALGNLRYFGFGALNIYSRKSVIFAQILKIRVRVDLRYESGRGLRALQDLAEIAAGHFFAKRLGVRAVLCRFVASANSDNSTLGFRAVPGLGTARPAFFGFLFIWAELRARKVPVRIFRL